MEFLLIVDCASCVIGYALRGLTSCLYQRLLARHGVYTTQQLVSSVSNV